MVILQGIFVRESEVGLIESDEDSRVVHEGRVVKFVVQKGG